MKQKIYKLELFEEFVISKGGFSHESFQRVPGGWIHKEYIGGDSGESYINTFVPYSEEFKNG